VVVVMEGNGISPQLLRVCQRLAAEGHTAIAPDLYHRFGGSDPEAWEQQFGARRDEDSLADLAACVALLRREGAGRVGITGFCMGGRLTYLAAVSGLDVQAAAPFYGGGIAEILGRPACPVLAFFGGADAYVPMSDIERIQAHHRDDAGVEIVVYPGAPHGFMRDGSADHEPEAATDAWARLTAFLSKHL
jgi:carboxymethylenebutenolidase